MKRVVLLLFVICTACGRNYNRMDISHHNAVNWDAVKSDGNLEFCYIKSTEGSTLTGRRCRAHLRKAKDAGPDSGAAEHHADWRLHQSDGAAESFQIAGEDLDIHPGIAGSV